VCLTFDDGYVDNFEIAAPLLEARGHRGTFFITAGAVQAQTPLWYDRAALMWKMLGGEKVRERVNEGDGADAPRFATRESWIEWLKAISNERRERIMSVFDSTAEHGASRGPLMTPDQVRQLAESGHEIGSHTLWHPILTAMRAEDRVTEIEQARKLLQQWTGREVAGFCYPNGDFDAEVIRQVDEAGHRYACTTRPGRNDDRTDHFRLRRIDMTCDRITTRDGSFDALGFRAEISLFREWIRRGVQLSESQTR
jgi:peptidoglycan/xylan/chitin deacetylase (PgdA/CDA1 family)